MDLARAFILLLMPLFGSVLAQAQTGRAPAGVWFPDNGDGTFTNPVIYADYSDPDVIRVGNDYYMTSSSFSHFPGLPILHSKDLVNWTIIGHAALSYPYEEFNVPQHGKAIWAPSLRHHNGEFVIYVGDPDKGIFRTTAKNPAGPWETLRLIRKVTGWIDPCPFWDDNGNAYLVHAFANSRVGIKSILAINRMNSEGTQILDDGIVVFVGHTNHPTIEGPKLYKRNGYYYIFAPAGGVKPGWQTILRSRNIFGPYEDKIVLKQGSTSVNGPHQGGWVTTPTGEDWFLHFQDRYAYGRIVHLQPMHWENDWPVIGVNQDKDGIGEPVTRYKKPSGASNVEIQIPQTSDEFDAPELGLQWQWQANGGEDWISLTERRGWLRFRTRRLSDSSNNIYNVPALLLQKFPGPKFTASIRLEPQPQSEGERSGLVVFGMDYATLTISKAGSGYRLMQSVCAKADKGNPEETIAVVVVNHSQILLRVSIRPEAEKENIPKVVASFSYSEDGERFKPIGKEFVVREGVWVGAKVGLLSIAHAGEKRVGYTDFDWFRIEALQDEAK